MVTKLRIAVALLVVSLIGVSGVGLCCASMARAEAEPHGCCPPEAGFSEARLSCCESPSPARAAFSDVTVTAPHAMFAGPAVSSPFAAAPGAPPLLRAALSSSASPPASSPILRI